MALDRSKIPQGREPDPFIFPQWQEFTLINGLTVVILPDRRFPQISYRLMIPSGATRDGRQSGLTSLTSELLSRGTKTKSSSEIAELTESIGGRLSTGSQWDASFGFISSLSKYKEKSLGLLAESILHPAFNDEDIQFLIDQRLNNLLMSRDSTSFLASFAMGCTLFPDHPFELPINGTPQSLKSFNRPAILQHYKKWIQPCASILIVLGDVDPDQILPGIEASFAEWKPMPWESYEFPIMPLIKKNQVVVVDKPDAVQSSIRVAHHGVSRKNPDMPAIIVMNTILGGYFGSRLNMNLREEKGFTYGVRSVFTERIFPGYFAVATDVRNEVTGDAVKEIFHEIRGMQKELIDFKTLENVRNFLVGRFPSDFETTDQLSQALMELKLYGFDENYFSRLRNQISRVTAEQVLDAARKYLNPDNAIVVVGGKASEVAPQLSQFGDVTLFESELI
ncbi:MAG: insulinase family protein [Bacteroidetes bacterium]|nr:insulinase family protein [Bacteroidota bacterium]